MSSIHHLYSLSVSPDPDQPLIATIIQLSGVDKRKLRVYNYKTKELKQELELGLYNDNVPALYNTEKTTKPAIVVFHPYGE